MPTNYCPWRRLIISANFQRALLAPTGPRMYFMYISVQSGAVRPPESSPIGLSNSVARSSAHFIFAFAMPHTECMNTTPSTPEYKAFSYLIPFTVLLAYNWRAKKLLCGRQGNIQQ